MVGVITGFIVLASTLNGKIDDTNETVDGIVIASNTTLILSEIDANTEAINGLNTAVDTYGTVIDSLNG